MILIINKSRKEAEALAAAFRCMGIVARAETPEHACAELSPLYHAILIDEPRKLPDECEYIVKLRSYISGIPIIALTENSELVKGRYEATVKRTATASQLYRAICELCDAIKKHPPGEYMLAGINASIQQAVVTYFSEPLPLTKTERLILRFLIRAYPSSSTPKRILKYSFSQTKTPEASSVKTHICSINSKFKRCLNRNLIVSIDGGYVIMTPILAKEKHFNFISAIQ